jgi:hypothetical protein
MTIASATTAGWKASNVLNVRNSLFLRRQVKENSSQVRKLHYGSVNAARSVRYREGEATAGRSLE